MTQIKKVAVIGAGVMGAGIAAHVANSGHDVLLLDIVPQDAKDRNVIAKGACAKLLKSDPAPLTHKKNIKRITAGNIEDDLSQLSQCDWIIEAVIERLDIKQSLYAKIDQVRKSDAIVSSNTSTIPLNQLTQNMSQGMKKNFLITHFFNPPRYMRLLEIVKGENTDQEAVDRIKWFADHCLGKSIVDCKDRPGFIANRLGIYWVAMAIQEAIEQGLTVEEADSVIGRPCGIPKTGVFALMDLVGLDLMPHVVGSMLEALPKDDPFVLDHKPHSMIEKLIADGYTGRKGKGGFYRINKESGKKVKEAIDLKTGKFRPSVKSGLQSASLKPNKLRELVTHKDKGGRFAWKVLAKTLCYAARLIPESADNVVAIDEAMRLGYNWKFGPFQLIDKLGIDWFIKALEADKMDVPDLLKQSAGQNFYKIQDNKPTYLTLNQSYQSLPRPEGVILLEDIKLQQDPLLKNGSASVWDLGSGVLCLEFTSKMNSLDPNMLKILNKTIRLVEKKHKALVIYNEGSNFSVGANLGLALFAANISAWSEIENMIETGQETYKRLKYASFPVVGAPSGMALGGGCEILLHCDAIQAHIESYVGLVECGVGLIPGWGGCKELIDRWSSSLSPIQGPMVGPSKAFEIISTATVAKSAEEAKSHLFFRPSDRITMNRYRLLADAKARALELAANYEAPKERTYNLPGPSAHVAFEMAVNGFHRLGRATDYDRVVAHELAYVLSGGDTDVTESLCENDILTLEREAFMRLVKTTGTLDRIEHMLIKGKPLRN